mmetsp:Transcript_16256/g.33435  ORF Transcript_16256/g.33435 Transcript_16256/m.33435 type:complete len:251 (-) Transcript_16256:658-1410(-)
MVSSAFSKRALDSASLSSNIFIFSLRNSTSFSLLVRATTIFPGPFFRLLAAFMNFALSCCPLSLRLFFFSSASCEALLAASRTAFSITLLSFSPTFLPSFLASSASPNHEDMSDVTLSFFADACFAAGLFSLIWRSNDDIWEVDLLKLPSFISFGGEKGVVGEGDGGLEVGDPLLAAVVGGPAAATALDNFLISKSFSMLSSSMCSITSLNCRTEERRETSSSERCSFSKIVACRALRTSELAALPLARS